VLITRKLIKALDTEHRDPELATEAYAAIALSLPSQVRGRLKQAVNKRCPVSHL
jgi:hypothetical protein